MIERRTDPPAADTTSPPAETSSGVWYAALIGAVLLIATAIYAFFLYREAEELRRAAEQLSVGRDMLRGDRDEILQKARDLDITISTLEAVRERDAARIDGLEDQRSKLQSEVLRLTETLAATERRAEGTVSVAEGSIELDRLQRERDRLARSVDGYQADIERLQRDFDAKDQALRDQAESLERNELRIEAFLADRADLDAATAATDQDLVQLERQLARRVDDERRRQIVRGHQASLGEVQPYIAEVGPEDWRVIESWLAGQLRRPMAVPDLAAHGWSYEGARLLGSPDGPPMVMLLYADAEERPASLTVALDNGGGDDDDGERPLASDDVGGLDVLSWRDERHALFLTGESGEAALRAVAEDVRSAALALDEDAPVPVSRYVRPSLRPEPSL